LLFLSLFDSHSFIIQSVHDVDVWKEADIN